MTKTSANITVYVHLELTSFTMNIHPTHPTTGVTIPYRPLVFWQVSLFNLAGNTWNREWICFVMNIRATHFATGVVVPYHQLVY